MSEAALTHIPSPADPALPTAAEFLASLRARGARIYRMREESVFCLTDDERLAADLHELGALPYLPRQAERALEGMPLGAFRRARGGKVEWDFWIHRVDISGDESIWEAAGRLAERTVDYEEFA